MFFLEILKYSVFFFLFLFLYVYTYYSFSKKNLPFGGTLFQKDIREIFEVKTILVCQNFKRREDAAKLEAYLTRFNKSISYSPVCLFFHF